MIPDGAHPVTETISPTANVTTQKTIEGETSTWTGLALSTKPNITKSTPGGAFQITEIYTGRDFDDVMDFSMQLDGFKAGYESILKDKDSTPEEKAEARAKASVERAEKFKKSVGKAVTGMKAKMHGGMADYAGKRGLIPAKTKMKKPDGRSKAYRGEGGKDALAKDKAKFAKAKDR